MLDSRVPLRYLMGMNVFAFAIGSLLAVASIGRGQNLLGNGSFELPAVTSQTELGGEGSPSIAEGDSAWASLTRDTKAKGGQVHTGLTNEIARTGKQSLYILFDKVAVNGEAAVLESKPISVQPEQEYRLSIWGRIDRVRPLTLDERRPAMWLDIEFLKADRETEAGESGHTVQLIPGSITVGVRNTLLFVSNKWSETSSVFKTPPGTAFVRLTWTWMTPKDEGETDGVVYWDDATLEAQTSPPAGQDKSGTPPAAAGSKRAPAPGKPSGAANQTPADQ